MVKGLLTGCDLHGYSLPKLNTNCSLLCDMNMSDTLYTTRGFEEVTLGSDQPVAMN